MMKEPKIHLKLAPQLDRPATIIRLEGAGNYSILHRVGAKPEVLCRTLLFYQVGLPGWIRISRSHLVNPAFIKSINFGTEALTITLKDKTVLPISRRKNSQVKQQLQEHPHILKNNAYVNRY